MENNSKKPTASTKRTASSTTSKAKSTISSPMSAEEKLKKSLKGLSYTGAGASGGKLTAEEKPKATKAAERKKVGGVVLDMDTIQDANKQKFETKGRRHNVVILILSLLLIVSLVYLIVSIMNFRNRKEEANLLYKVNGDAYWIIEGGTKTEFAMRQGLATDMMYLIDSKLCITTTDAVRLTIEIKVLLNGEEILLPGITEHDEKIARLDEDSNIFVYQDIIMENKTIQIFKGLDFSEAPTELTSNNVYIEIIATVTNV